MQTATKTGLLARKALNDRFRLVYQKLQDNGIIVQYDRTRSKTKFAQKLGMRTNQIDRCLAGTYPLTYEAAVALCNGYGVNRAYMLEGIGSAFGGVPPGLKSDVTTVTHLPLGRVTYVGLAACASTSIGEDAHEVEELYMIPGISGDMVAFNVQGNSMEPTFKMGDIIFCTQIESKSDLIDGEVFVVSFRSEKAINVKRIERVFDRRGNWTHLRCVSDNKEYDPFDVEVSDLRAAYRVARRLSSTW